jgi:hypothetical protein
MKKLVFITALILLTGTAFGQTLQKGTVIGFHNGTFTPNPDVTMNQLLNFVKDRMLPEYEKNLPGSKCYLVKGIRGEFVNCINMLIIFQSDAVRNKYWNKDGTYTDMGKAAFEKMKPVQDELVKYGKMVDKYTDWEIQ